MPIRRSSFTPPPKQVPRAPVRIRQEFIEPVSGLDTASPPQNLAPGQTPFSQNFDVDDRCLRVRSGESRWGAVALGTDKALGVARINDVLGTDYTVVVSDATASVRSEGATGWTTLTSCPNSSASTAYKDFAYGYAPSLDESALIMCDGIAAPVYWSPVASAWAAVGDFDSHESFAKHVAFFDNRAVFFNMGSRTTLPYATRVRWSQRGNPLEYTDQDAGFEDLADMKGEGKAIFAEADRLVLFSEEEVWIARSRRDQYVFEFFPLARNVGLPQSRAAAITDKGIIWLDNEYRFRLVAGNAIYTFNDETQKFLKDTVREPSEMWAAFDPNEGLFKLNFSDTTAQYPSRSLWLRTDTVTADPANPNELRGVWMHQDFPDQVTAGVEEVQVTSKGTAYRLLSQQTTDDAVAIDARWRSHAMRLRNDPDMKEMLTQGWLDYQADSSSSLSLYHSGDLSGTLTHAGAFSLTSGNNTAHLPFLTPAQRYQQIELRESDGGQPRIVNLRLELRQYTGRF